jgi:protein-L-isoaspartate(D-aspartate) O-methyltransferase
MCLQTLLDTEGTPMNSQQELQNARRRYAKQVLAAAGVSNSRIEDAFASVPREGFLGPGPWSVCRAPGLYTLTPSADPVCLYTNDLFGIVTDRGLNNGQPSLHAALMHAAGIERGEHVLHVGAGTGYYSAIMAHIVGARGSITAIEFDADIASRAKANFMGQQNVQVVAGDGARVSFAPVDVIYVNAGVTRPAPTWLDGLKNGGRLLLPFTTNTNFTTSHAGQSDFSQVHAQAALSGAVFLIERAGDAFSARWIGPVAIFPAEGCRDEASELALAAAMQAGKPEAVTRLYRTADRPAEHCWLRGDDWCLAYE